MPHFSMDIDKIMVIIMDIKEKKNEKKIKRLWMQWIITLHKEMVNYIVICLVLEMKSMIFYVFLFVFCM